MAKIVKDQLQIEDIYLKPSRLRVPVPHIELDQSVEVEQGQERTVKQLYEDYVLGRLDVRDLGGKVQYDPQDAQECDPMNQFGVTLEETTTILENGRAAYQEMQETAKRNAATKQQQQQQQQQQTPA